MGRILIYQESGVASKVSFTASGCEWPKKLTHWVGIFVAELPSRLVHAECLLDLRTHVYDAVDAPQKFLGYPRLGG